MTRKPSADLLDRRFVCHFCFQATHNLHHLLWQIMDKGLGDIAREIREEKNTHVPIRLAAPREAAKAIQPRLPPLLRALEAQNRQAGGRRHSRGSCGSIIYRFFCSKVGIAGWHRQQAVECQEFGCQRCVRDSIDRVPCHRKPAACKGTPLSDL